MKPPYQNAGELYWARGHDLKNPREARGPREILSASRKVEVAWVRRAIRPARNSKISYAG